MLAGHARIELLAGERFREPRRTSLRHKLPRSSDCVRRSSKSRAAA